MGNPLKKVRTGEKLVIPAATFNTMIDAARDFKRRQQNRASTGQAYFHQTGIVLVANNSGGDRNRFDVLGVTEPIIRPEDNPIEFTRRPTFRGVRPTASHKGRFVVLLEPVKDGHIAHAVIAGVTVARVRVDFADDPCCDVTPDKHGFLQTCLDGSAQILWKQRDSGTCWAIVRLGNICAADSGDGSDSWSDSDSFSDSDVVGCRGKTETVRVLLATPYRSGDSLCFPAADLRFVDGCYKGRTAVDPSCHYICCDESSSSETPADDSQTPPVDDSSVPTIPDDSSSVSISVDDSSSDSLAGAPAGGDPPAWIDDSSSSSSSDSWSW